MMEIYGDNQWSIPMENEKYSWIETLIQWKLHYVWMKLFLDTKMVKLYASSCQSEDIRPIRCLHFDSKWNISIAIDWKYWHKSGFIFFVPFNYTRCVHYVDVKRQEKETFHVRNPIGSSDYTLFMDYTSLFLRPLCSNSSIAEVTMFIVHVYVLHRLWHIINAIPYRSLFISSLHLLSHF